MEIILLERIEKLGQMGEIVTVKNGYARNFLLPRGRALRATKANIERFDHQRVEFAIQATPVIQETDSSFPVPPCASRDPGPPGGQRGLEGVRQNDRFSISHGLELLANAAAFAQRKLPMSHIEPDGSRHFGHPLCQRVGG